MQNEFPTALLNKCPPLPVPDTGSDTMTMGDLLVYTVDLQGLYIKCAIRFDAVIDAIHVENEVIRNKNKEK
jgi:hypothetical protein